MTVDHYSDYIEVDVLKDLTGRCMAETCRVNFARHGVPQLVVTDNGTHFINEEMKKMAISWNFEHSTSAPHHQQANGKAEAAVKIVKHLIRKAEETGQSFWYVLLHWRNIPNKIGSSPTSRLFSRSTRCGVPASAEKYTPKIVPNVPEAILENRRKTKYYYDRKSRNLPELETGSPVFVQLHPDVSKLWTPAVVNQKLNSRSYIVDVNGSRYRRDLVNIKPRKEPASSPPSLAQAASSSIESGNVHNNDPALTNVDAEISSQTKSMPTLIALPEYESNPPEVRDFPHRFEETSQATPTQAAMEIASMSETPKARPRRERKLPKKLSDYIMDE